MEFIEATAFTKYLYDYLSEDEYLGLQSFLLQYPESGKIVPGSGGVRKIRWAIPGKGKGKSGGSRIIYFFYNETIPLLLLTIFGKNEKVNLSKAEQNELIKLVKELIKSYKR